ncbi:MAG: 50S ribosomal protein L13 [bacterium]
MKTRSILKKEVIPVHYLIDAKGKNYGKLVVMVSKLLLGKNKVNFVRYIPIIDKVTIKNAKLVDVTPTRLTKAYHWHSMFPGGIKEGSFELLREKNPDKLYRISLQGMLPKNRLGRRMLEAITIFPDERVPELEYKVIDNI